MLPVFVPNYYKSFKCIADKCRHTCCAGWEIDVDDISLERFSSYPEIRAKIDDCRIRLGEDERCSFLLDNGLCSMIIEYGEDMLCDICKDHPRFLNYYEDHIEMGLGLCCEAVCAIVLQSREKFELVPSIKLSNEIINMQDRDVDICMRLCRLNGCLMSFEKRIELFYFMERLDDEWTTMLDRLKCRNISDEQRERYLNDNAIVFEQLAVYYLFRYPDIPGFAVESCYLIALLAISEPDKSLPDIVRMYSSEVEYSDVNMGKIYSLFT